MSRWTRLAPFPGDPRRAWLRAPGSLTRRLAEVWSGVRVELLFQGRARPLADEHRALGLRPGDHAIVREVILHGGQRPLVFAHTVVAQRDLAGAWRELRGLGRRPLAEVLHGDPRVRRGPFSLQRLGARHGLVSRAQRHLGALPPLWARRSLFHRGGRALLLTEVFLPGVDAAPRPGRRGR